MWRTFGAELRRAEALQLDLSHLQGLGARAVSGSIPSPAAAAYVARLGEAAAAEAGGGPPLLLGHFYCRSAPSAEG